jgi:hypothetical protein
VFDSLNYTMPLGKGREWRAERFERDEEDMILSCNDVCLDALNIYWMCFLIGLLEVTLSVFPIREFTIQQD